MELQVLLARVDVSLLCFFAWYLGVLLKFVLNITLPFIIKFVAYINEDNEGLNSINPVNLNLLNVVFINWHGFIFLIDVSVNKVIGSY
jgi:hypothetical protein